MRIVLVDPSRTVHRIVTQLIEQGQHEVRPFTDGREALEYIKTDPDVRALITSAEPISMPGANLCAEARALANGHRPLYILLMSSSDDQMILVKALDNGADDFIHKPPVAEELRARLRAADRVTLMQQELIQHATTDFLTGTLNRRAFFAHAKEVCAQAAAGKALSAIMIDIDHFKQVNDVHGHQVGDVVLRGVAAELSASGYIVGRLGGEEFCILVANSILDAIGVAEDLRHTISKLLFDAESGALAVTCSCGVAEWEAEDTIDRLLRRADMALYEAKHAGRNRVIASDSYSISKSHEEWRGVARSGRPRGN